MKLSAEKEIILKLPDDSVKELLRRAGYPGLNHQASTAKEETGENNEPKDVLKGIVGMTEIKGQILKLVSFFQMQKIAADRGLSGNKVNLNMIFIGNPGTGKTKMARMISQIFFMAGIIPKNKLIECSRAELIAKYEGHTAPNIKAVVKKALGGVLFIDEAYSLVEEGDRANFGKEAIETLLQEAENHRGELVIILAGYPQQMEAFLDSNPGLKSRFPNVIKFPDYSVQELYEIALYLAKEAGYSFGDDVKGKLHQLFEAARKYDNFGNARCARNILEFAEINKADKLTREHKNLHALSNEQLFRLTAEDFCMPPMIGDMVEKRKIGF